MVRYYKKKIVYEKMLCGDKEAYILSADQFLDIVSLINFGDVNTLWERYAGRKVTVDYVDSNIRIRSEYCEELPVPYGVRATRIWANTVSETIGSIGYVNEAAYTVKFIEYAQPTYVEVYDNTAPIKYTAGGNNLKPEIKSVVKTNAGAGSLGTSSTASVTWKEVGAWGNWITTDITVNS